MCTFAFRELLCLFGIANVGVDCRCFVLTPLLGASSDVCDSEMDVN